MGRNMVRLTFIIPILLGVALLAGHAGATGPTLLTVNGGAQDGIVLTLDDLRAMGRTEMTTSTPWTEGPQTFAGVTGAQLASAVGARGQAISAVANNNYSVTIPFEVFADPATLIAYEHNGQPMPVRAKGPLWILFPFDRDAKYRTDTYRAYAVWGLSRVEFR